MTRLHRAFLAFLSLILLPCPGQSQTLGSWEVTPLLGMSVPFSDVGPLGVKEGPGMLTVKTMDQAMSFGLLVTRELGRSGWALAARGLYTTNSDASGTFDCVPGLYCPYWPPAFHVTARSWAGVAGVMFRPLAEAGAVDPFLTSGAGWKRTRYTWPNQEGEGRSRVHQSETRGMVQIGLGFDMTVQGTHLRIEASDLWTPEGKRLDPEEAGPEFSGLQLPRRAAEHGLLVSVGWVLSLG